MIDVRVAELAARQHNRFSRTQLSHLGVGEDAIRHRLAQGRWVRVHDAVFAIAPVSDDPRGRWMGAVLTSPGSVLSHASAGAAWGWWTRPRLVEVVTRPGDGGPCRSDGVLVHRSETLAQDTTTHLGIPLTAAPRTLLDLAPRVTVGALSRCVREAIRLRTTSVTEIVDALATRHRGRRGCRKLLHVVSRYSGLPVDRARSGSEVIALEILRDAGRPAPRLNHRIAGEEADLSWAARRLIVEIDGGPFHLDRGEDERKQRIWERAGWTVRRVPSGDLLTNPASVLALAPNVDEHGA